MLNRSEYIQSMQHEFKVIRHLFEQIPENSFDFKFSDKQRSTRELLAYIATITGSILSALSNDGQWGETKMSSVTPENFIGMLNEDEKKSIELVNAFSEDDLNKELDLFRMGQMRPIKSYMNDAIKILVAYKMQLFLQIKASGNQNIGTSNLWGGFSMN